MIFENTSLKGISGSIREIRKIWSLTANSLSLQAAALKICYHNPKIVCISLILAFLADLLIRQCLTTSINCDSTGVDGNEIESEHTTNSISSLEDEMDGEISLVNDHHEISLTESGEGRREVPHLL